MKKNMVVLLLAVVVVLALFSLPLWLPGLLTNQAAAGEGANPLEGALILLDGGSTTGQIQLHVQAVPQVLGWVPGQAEFAWTTETGFLFGGISSADYSKLYVVEHRKLGVESVLNLDISENEMYRPNKNWGVFLTTLDPKNGDVLDRQQLPDLPYINYSDVSLFPMATQGEVLYLMNYADKNNLFAYNLKTHQFSDQAWTVCEKGYPMRLVYVQSLSVALCIDYSDKPMSWVTVTSLSSGETGSVEIPAMGKQGFVTGNGLVLSEGRLYVLDTDAGALLEVNTATMQIGQPISYRSSLEKEQSSLGHRFVDWLLRLAAQPAAAKRWMALTAGSPDGRWLAVDGGLGDVAMNNGKPSVILIDTHSLQATQSVDLSSTPGALAFANDGELIVFFEKNSGYSSMRGLLINIDTGEQSSFNIDLHGWLMSVLPAD